MERCRFSLSAKRRDREPNDVNHTEPELCSQAVNEMKVRVVKRTVVDLSFWFFVTLMSFIAPGDWPVVAAKHREEAGRQRFGIY